MDRSDRHAGTDPKCPACVAAYVALATGIGISFPTATCLRSVLAVLCVTSLVFITARRLRSLVAPALSQHCPDGPGRRKQGGLGDWKIPSSGSG